MSKHPTNQISEGSRWRNKNAAECVLNIRAHAAKAVKP